MTRVASSRIAIRYTLRLCPFSSATLGPCMTSACHNSPGYRNAKRRKSFDVECACWTISPSRANRRWSVEGGRGISSGMSPVARARLITWRTLKSGAPFLIDSSVSIASGDMRRGCARSDRSFGIRPSRLFRWYFLIQSSSVPSATRVRVVPGITWARFAMARTTAARTDPGGSFMISAMRL